jgi:hypothetical protein
MSELVTNTYIGTGIWRSLPGARQRSTGITSTTGQRRHTTGQKRPIMRPTIGQKRPIMSLPGARQRSAGAGIWRSLPMVGLFCPYSRSLLTLVWYHRPRLQRSLLSPMLPLKSPHIIGLFCPVVGLFWHFDTGRGCSDPCCRRCYRSKHSKDRCVCV